MLLGCSCHCLLPAVSWYIVGCIQFSSLVSHKCLFSTQTRSFHQKTNLLSLQFPSPLSSEYGIRLHGKWKEGNMLVSDP